MRTLWSKERKMEALVYIDSHNFVINGEPISYPENQHSSHFKMWSSHKEHKVKYELNLSNQYDGKPLMKGPLALEIAFYFKLKRDGAKIHVQPPDLNRLIRFIEETCKGIIYEKDSLITNIVASKKYDKLPRTQFTIGKIKV